MSDDIVKALNRVEGQVRGVKRMYEEGRDCEHIIQQVAAARSALKRVAKELLTDEAVKCSKAPEPEKRLRAVIESVLKIG